MLGNGLSLADRHEESLSVREAELSMDRRVGAPEESILATQGNLAVTYHELGRSEQALRLKRDVYSGTLKLYGKEHKDTLTEAYNYACSLLKVGRFEEARSVLRENILVGRRVLGEGDDLTLSMRANYALALHVDDSATIDDLREAVTTLEDTERTARRVLGGQHPTTDRIEQSLRRARAVLAARE